jgi:hypothetical protein
LTMRRMLVMLCLAAAVLCAQPAAPKPNQRLIVLKYADPQAVANLVRTFGANTQVNAAMRAVAIDARTEAWPAIEDAIQQLDVPQAAPKNVELILYFVMGSDKELPLGASVPPEIQPVIAQLKNAFTLKNYRLMDSLVLRARTGQEAEASGMQAGGTIMQFRMRAASVGPGGVIHIDQMKAGMRVAVTLNAKGDKQYLDTGINTDIDVKDGQKVVVGRSSLEGPEKAVFLVLSAKVIE